MNVKNIVYTAGRSQKIAKALNSNGKYLSGFLPVQALDLVGIGAVTLKLNIANRQA